MNARVWIVLGLASIMAVAGCGPGQMTSPQDQMTSPSLGARYQVLAEDPVPAINLSADEQKLYDLLMAYRAANGLPAIPVSISLTKVARLHVADTRDNKPNQGDCNQHSWSAMGTWKAVCYTSDHAQSALMWSKPRELTTYKGNGYEISGSASPMTPEQALAGWQASPRHNEVILNKGIWSDPWKAIGIGIEGNVSHVWFGNEADPAVGGALEDEPAGRGALEDAPAGEGALKDEPAGEGAHEDEPAGGDALLEDDPAAGGAPAETAVVP